MAYGSHWEWRGFGGVDARFTKRFRSLSKLIDQHSQSDYYIYAPGLTTNLKIRQGKESGLKFKHPGKTDGDFEIWSEYEDELFEFPLPSKGLDLLEDTLNSTDLGPINSIPSGINNPGDTLPWLKEIGCRVIEVEKAREIRELHLSTDTILVEWTCIYKPQALISISVESEHFEKSDKQQSSKNLKLIKSAYRKLELHRLPLLPRNYSDAVAIWAKSNKI